MVALATAGCDNGELTALRQEVSELNDPVESLTNALRRAEDESEDALRAVAVCEAGISDCERSAKLDRLFNCAQ